MQFKTAAIATVSVVLLHVVLMLTGAYWHIANIDKPMHFLGGFVMGLFGLAIHHAVASHHHTKKSPWWYHYLFVTGFVMLIGVAWEFHEYILDNTAVLWYGWPKSQLSLNDTMADLLLDLVGGSLAFSLFKRSL